jgi:hypothetical protein
MGEAAVAFWTPRWKEMHSFVGTLDAVAKLGEALAGLPCRRPDNSTDTTGGDEGVRGGQTGRDEGGRGGAGGLLCDFHDLGESVLPAMAELRGRLMLAAEYAAQVLSGAGGSGGVSGGAGGSGGGGGSGGKRGGRSKSRSSSAGGEGSADGASWLFYNGGALSELVVLPAPGISESFDDAVRFVVAELRRNGPAAADDPTVAAAAAVAAAEAARIASAAVADFAAGRHRWRAVVSAAADLDCLQSFALRTGPASPAAAAAGHGARFCRPVFLDDNSISDNPRSSGGGGMGRRGSNGGAAHGSADVAPNRLLLRDSWHPLVPVPRAASGVAFVRNDVVLGDPDPEWERPGSGGRDWHCPREEWEDAGYTVGQRSGDEDLGQPPPHRLHSAPVMLLTGPNMGMFNVIRTPEL